MSEQVEWPEHGIMCFHCGETFTTYGAAQDHFGATPLAEPGCVIDRVAVEEGGKPERGRGLLMALRKAEQECDEWRQRALAGEMHEEMHAGLRSELRRYFGTDDPWTIHDRYDNMRYRVEHVDELIAVHANASPADTPERDTEVGNG